MLQTITYRCVNVFNTRNGGLHPEEVGRIWSWHLRAGSKVTSQMMGGWSLGKPKRHVNQAKSKTGALRCRKCKWRLGRRERGRRAGPQVSGRPSGGSLFSTRLRRWTGNILREPAERTLGEKGAGGRRTPPEQRSGGPAGK